MTSLVLTLAATVGLGALAPAPEDNAEAVEAPAELFYSARVVVDVSELEKKQEAASAEKTRKWLHEDLSALLRDNYRIPVVDEGTDVATVTVRLVFVDYMDSKYAITIEVTRPDDVPTEPIAYECSGCFEHELSDRMAEEVEAIVERLQREPPAATNVGTDEPDGSEDGPEEPAVRPSRPLKIAGYSSIGLGGALLVGGVVALTRPVQAPDDSISGARNWRPLGIGLAAGGGVALATGVALVLVAARRCKASKSCGSPSEAQTTSMSPWLDRSSAGLTFTRRF